MARRKLEVEIAGDATGLAKTLGTAVGDLRRFDGAATASLRGLVGGAGAARGSLTRMSTGGLTAVGNLGRGLQQLTGDASGLGKVGGAVASAVSGDFVGALQTLRAETKPTDEEIRKLAGSSDALTASLAFQSAGWEDVAAKLRAARAEFITGFAVANVERMIGAAGGSETAVFGERESSEGRGPGAIGRINAQRFGGFAPPGRPERQPGWWGPPARTLIPRNLQENLLNAQIRGDDAKARKVLEAQADALRGMLGQDKLTGKARTRVKEELLGVVGQIRAFDEQVAADARAKTADAKRAAAEAARQAAKDREEHKRALREALKAQQKFMETLRERAEKLKDAAVKALDRKQEGRDTARAIQDATAELGLSRMIGSPTAIRDAKRALEDAKLDRQRFLIEGATFTPTTVNRPGGPRATASSGSDVKIEGGVHLHGTQNVNQLLRELQRLANTQATPRRGRYGGMTLGL